MLVSPLWPKGKLGVFQVKRHWADPAELTLIQHATSMLIEWCEEHPDAEVHLNFPGIGNGKLPVESVLPIIEELPDTVNIWRYRRG